MNPQRATITGPRLGGHVQGVMVSEPHVGDPMQLFLDNGKFMRTTEVQKVSHDGSELVVDTLNSQYRVRLIGSA